jgi:cytochrome c-type biogenesis protein CcmH
LTSFWPGALLLLLLAAGFLLLPGLFLRRRRREGVLASNRDWYRQREAELEGKRTDSGVDPSQREDLLQDARLRLLDDTATADAAAADAAAADAGDAALKPTAAGRWWVLSLVLSLAAVSILLYGQLGAAPDVALKQQLDGFSGEGSDADWRRLMLKVEDRAHARPDNLYYQAMLGSFYMEEGDYQRAAELYRELAQRAPNDAGAAARAAQAGFLAAGRKLTQRDQLLAERALSISPHQRTALGLLGMAAYEQGQYQAAINYWRRLLVMEEPDSSSAQMIQGIIARAEAALGGVSAPEPAVAGAVPPHAAVGGPAAQSGSTAAEPGGTGVTLRLELAKGVRTAPGDTVFVFARNSAIDTRMPVAARRLTAADLPITLRLDDASSMAGQKISDLAAVDVVARVSPSGQPGEQHATLQASISDLPPGPGEQVHTLVLKPVGES